MPDPVARVLDALTEAAVAIDELVQERRDDPEYWVALNVRGDIGKSIDMVNALSVRRSVRKQKHQLGRGRPEIVK